MCSNENAKPAMKLIKKKDCLLFFFYSCRWNVSNFIRPISAADNQIIYVISIQFHVLLIFDHFYGLSSVFNAKVVSFIIITTYLFMILCCLYFAISMI